MSKKKKKRKGISHSIFYRIYFVLLILSLAAIGVGAKLLWDIIAEYEATRPVYVAREAAKLFEQGDYESIYPLDTATSVLLETDTAQDYANFMRAYTQGKAVTWQESFSKNSDEKLYRVLLDGGKFATFTLHTTGVQSKHGNDTWMLSSVTTNALKVTDYVITAPSDSVVTVNGRTLTEADAIETDIKTASDGMLPDGVKSPTMTKYKFSLCLSEPSISVTDHNGNPQTVEGDAENGFSCALPSDETLRELYEENIIKVAKKLANYTSEDLSRETMLTYTKYGSPAYKNIRNFYNGWCPPHIGNQFNNLQTSNYYAYSDTCFSVDVSFQYVITYRKNPDNVYETKYTLYFTKGKKGYELYNFSMN